MNITLCVSVPNGGAEYLAFLAETAARTISGMCEVDLHVTCHDEEQRQILTSLASPLPISRSHVVPRETKKYFHASSVTHSRCVNALFGEVNGDIAVICDYDGALVMQDWDLVLEEQITHKQLAFWGAPYASTVTTGFRLPFGMVPAMKYQGKPNCIFIAFAPARIKRLADRLCDFADRFGSENSLPAKLISNPSESRTYGLPVGTIAHLDTGSRIPELVEQHQLRCGVLRRQTSNYRVVREPAGFDQCPEILRPEEYFLDDTPFFVHFRKGVNKTVDKNAYWEYEHPDFARDVRGYLDTTP